MVMRPNKLIKTPPASRGNSPNRNNGKLSTSNPTTPNKSNSTPKSSPSKSKLGRSSSVKNSPNRSIVNNNRVNPISPQRRNNSNKLTPKRNNSPMKAMQNGLNSLRKASPARTPPDFEFIINNNTRQRQLIKSSSNRSSRGTSPAKSENSTILHSRGSE